MARSKSSRSTCNFFLAFLVLWSTISLIVIVVWVTWPQLKSVGQCKAAQQAVVEKTEGAKVVRAQERELLQNQIRLGQENRTRLQNELAVIMATLRESHASLLESQQTNVALKENMTALEKEIDSCQRIQETLSAKGTEQEAHIDMGRANLTWTLLQLDSCFASNKAAVAHEEATKVQTRACQSGNALLLKQLNACKTEGGSRSH
ncbi:uncharacterized protein LOC114789172 [Denticeps clupeoides]|nr:uncharacterized protein LOC114789172 [Denticeps clupeoides]